MGFEKKLREIAARLRTRAENSPDLTPERKAHLLAAAATMERAAASREARLGL